MNPPVVIDPRYHDAVIFDLYGVLAIPIHYRGLRLHLRVSGKGVVISVDPRGNGEIEVQCRGEVKRLTPGGTVRFAG